jgi:hypothetical protein
MIDEQKALEGRFEELVAAQHGLRNLPNKSKLRENQARFVALLKLVETQKIKLDWGKRFLGSSITANTETATPS